MRTRDIGRLARMVIVVLVKPFAEGGRVLSEYDSPFAEGEGSGFTTDGGWYTVSSGVANHRNAAHRIAVPMNATKEISRLFRLLTTTMRNLNIDQRFWAATLWGTVILCFGVWALVQSQPAQVTVRLH